MVASLVLKVLRRTLLHDERSRWRRKLLERYVELNAQQTCEDQEREELCEAAHGLRTKNEPTAVGLHRQAGPRPGRDSPCQKNESLPAPCRWVPPIPS